MKRIKGPIYYFFNGVKVIANNKIAVIIIFITLFVILNNNINYKNKLKEYTTDENDVNKYVKLSTKVNYNYSNSNEENKKSEEAASSLVKCINEKIEYKDLDDNTKKLINDLNNLYNENDRYFSFAYKDLYTGVEITYNENAPISTASSIKAPAMIYIYEMASLGKIDLNEELTYTSNFYSGGSGVLQTKAPNTSYTVKTLVNYVIHDSDNIAYAMLMNRYKRENILEFWKEKGTNQVFTYNTIWGVTSTHDALIYMQELYNFYKSNDEYGNELMNMFKNAGWKILTNKDGEFNTANKGGWAGQTFHDIAIVYEENPYILAVMSNTGENYSEYTYLFNKTSKLVGELHDSYWQNKLEKCKEIKQY